MVNRPAWDQNFFDWPNRVWARFIMRILSMHRTLFFSYWVYPGRRLFHTEYTQDIVFFILSIRRTSSFSYWVYAGRRLFHTEYRLDWQRMMEDRYFPSHNHHPKLYWVYAGRRLFHIEYAQDVSFSYWVCAVRRLSYTEYAQDVVLFILSIHRMQSELYWV